MTVKLSTGTKVLLVSGCFALSIIGFMIKLPLFFRHVDKELHSLFYFSAALLLNILFSNRKVGRHVFLFIALFLFGVTIEYAQEYSNELLHRRIHGRFDIEDVKANLKGLVFFSILWIIYIAMTFARSKLKFVNVGNRGNHL